MLALNWFQHHCNWYSYKKNWIIIFWIVLLMLALNWSCQWHHCNWLSLNYFDSIEIKLRQYCTFDLISVVGHASDFPEIRHKKTVTRFVLQIWSAFLFLGKLLFCCFWNVCFTLSHCIYWFPPNCDIADIL